MATQLITHLLSMYGIKHTPQLIKISELVEDIDVKIKNKACYDNSLNSVMSAPQKYEYCLCYISLNGLPIEHAIIYDKTNDRYYDPTLQNNDAVVTLDKEYHLVKRFTFDELTSATIDCKRAPDLYALSRLSKKLH